MRRQYIRRSQPIPPSSITKRIKFKYYAPPLSQIPQYQKDQTIKIAIVQPGAYGDNINSTLMLKPIKKKYPDCIIDVHTSSAYHTAFLNNPYITNIIQYAASTKEEALHLLMTIPPQIQNSNYDMIFVPHPMVNVDKWSCALHQEWGENLIFAWVRALEDRSIPYDIPLETIIQLTDFEIARVNAFRQSVHNMQHRRNILMEIHGESGQTFWDHNWTIGVGKHLLSSRDSNLFISHKTYRDDIKYLQQQYPNHVYWVGSLTLRECAELFNHCQLFVSISSGLSNACNTTMCRRDVQWVEVVNSRTCSSAAIRSDGKLFWHDNNLQRFIAGLTERGI